MYNNQIKEETKCEILQVGREIILVKTVNPIQIVKVLKSLEYIIQITIIKILILQYQNRIVNIIKFKSKEN